VGRYLLLRNLYNMYVYVCMHACRHNVKSGLVNIVSLILNNIPDRVTYNMEILFKVYTNRVGGIRIHEIICNVDFSLLGYDDITNYIMFYVLYNY